jgi:hypothetical protein
MQTKTAFFKTAERRPPRPFRECLGVFWLNHEVLVRSSPRTTVTSSPRAHSLTMPSRRAAICSSASSLSEACAISRSLAAAPRTLR